MPDWRGLLLWNRGPNEYAAGLDLGDGRMLPPEDVIDGYSTRLIANRRSASRTVPVQVEDDLSAAITVMAPDLAPLASLAERVADAVPAVEPEPDFRRNLYEALERTHRQHLSQRALGTRPAPGDGGRRLVAALFAVAILVLIFGAVGWLTVRRIKRAHAPDLIV